MSKVSICKKCNTENSAGAKFCMNCGALLANDCPKCHFALDGNEKFCPQCGRPLLGVAGNETPLIQPGANQEWTQRELYLKAVELLSKIHAILRRFPPPEQGKHFLTTLPNVRQSLASLNEIAMQLEKSGLPEDWQVRFCESLALYVQLYFGDPNLEAEDVNALVACLRQYMPSGSGLIHSLSESERAEFAKKLAKTALANVLLHGLTDMDPFFEKTLPEEVLRDACLQSFRERFYLESWSIELKRQCLEVEEVRIRHGYYSDSVKQAVSKLRDNMTRKFKVYAEAEAEADNAIWIWLSPFSQHQVIEAIQKSAQMAGSPPVPLMQQSLTSEQVSVIEWIQKNGPYADKAMSTRILQTIFDLWKQDVSWLQWFGQVAETETYNVGRNLIPEGLIGKPSPMQAGDFFATNASVYWPVVSTLIYMSLQFLTRVYNIIALRLREPDAPFPETLPDQIPWLEQLDLRAGIHGADPDLALAFVPEHKSIRLLLDESQPVAATNGAQAQEVTPPVKTEVTEKQQHINSAKAVLEYFDLNGIDDTDSRKFFEGILKEDLAYLSSDLGIAHEKLQQSSIEELLEIVRNHALFK